MENIKVARHWGVAAVLVAGVVVIAGALLLFLVPARAQQPQACCPTVVAQWLPQPVLEAKFREKVLLDNVAIKNGLQAFAKNPGLTLGDMLKYVKGTYLEHPRLWSVRLGWLEGWDKILPELGKIIHPESVPTITSVTILIEYQPYIGAGTPAEDIDATAQIRITFSASPDGTRMDGTMKHSRICEVI
jgi:hypothetical protein